MTRRRRTPADRPTRKQKTTPEIIHDDGLDCVVSVDADTANEFPDWMRDKDEGFETLRHAKEFWQAVAAAHPVEIGTQDARMLTPGAYAREILWLIPILRDAIAESPNRERFILLALRLSHLITDAKWRFGRGELIRATIQRRGQLRTAGHQSGDIRRETHGRVLARVGELATEIRQAEPYDRYLGSTVWLATTIASRLQAEGITRTPATIRADLRKLAKK